MFIDLSETFDTIDHSMLLKKLEMCCGNITNLAPFGSYLNGKKQYIKIIECVDTLKQDDKYGVPHCTILGTLLFLLCKRSL